MESSYLIRLRHLYRDLLLGSDHFRCKIFCTEKPATDEEVARFDRQIIFSKTLNEVSGMFLIREIIT